MTDAERHHRLVEALAGGRGRLLTSPGVRGFPAAAPGLAELLGAVPPLAGRVADVTGSAGGGALAASPSAHVRVLEPSDAALRAARRRFGGDPAVTVDPGLPWDLPPAAADAVVALPPGDKGSDRVRAELAACARALAAHGATYLAMHKDLGAKRYERDAARLFGSVEVVARERGWRVVRLGAPAAASVPGAEPGGTAGEEGTPPAAGSEAQPWRRFEALGREWWALPGVFAARGLDAGSAELLGALRALDPSPLRAAEVLDLGCGTGLLAGAALDAGAARVTAVDDDLAAVRSSRRNLAGRAATVLHSDLDAGLEPAARFDVVLANPPFHVAKQVRPALSRAFVETAYARLRPGGLLVMVANRALPYERALADWRGFDTLRTTAVFKVLRARR